MKSFLCTLFALSMSCALWAYKTWTDETGLTWKYEDLPDGTVSLWGSDSPNYETTIPKETAGTITVPATIAGKSVTKLNDYAFYKCNALTSVDFSQTQVTSIGSAAFSNCSSLTSISLPSGVTSIGASAFSSCVALKSLDLSHTKVDLIDIYVFYDCGSMTSVTLPSGLKAIKSASFFRCKSLTSITLPDKVTIIGSSAFAGCTLLTSVTFPDSITEIEERAFESCGSLLSVDLSHTKVMRINSRTFEGCKSLITVDLPAELEMICDWSFFGCSLLKSVKLSHTQVSKIYTGAFSGCSKLESVDFPVGFRAIGDSAFHYCNAILSAVFYDAPPEGMKPLTMVDHCIPLDKIRYPKNYAKEWIAAIGEKRQGLTDVYSQALVKATAEMVDSTQMKVTYTVSFPEGVEAPKTVKVRAVAFKDGVRSFAKIVPVVTDGTAPKEQTVGKVPNGTEVTVGAEQSFVWDISKDWASSDVKLGQVSVEILVQENGKLLPQELITIPEVKASEGVAAHPEMTITRNIVPSKMLFNALLWRYAELAQADKGTLNNELAIVSNKDEVAGKVYWNKKKAADFATNPSTKGVLIACADEITVGSYPGASIDETALLTYLYGQMGFEVLAGEKLAWAREATRLSLQSGTADSGYFFRPLEQRAVKVNPPTTPIVKE